MQGSRALRLNNVAAEQLLNRRCQGPPCAEDKKAEFPILCVDGSIYPRCIDGEATVVYHLFSEEDKSHGGNCPLDAEAVEAFLEQQKLTYTCEAWTQTLKSQETHVHIKMPPSRAVLNGYRGPLRFLVLLFVQGTLAGSCFSDTFFLHSKMVQFKDKSIVKGRRARHNKKKTPRDYSDLEDSASCDGSSDEEEEVKKRRWSPPKRNTKRARVEQPETVDVVPSHPHLDMHITSPTLSNSSAMSSPTESDNELDPIFLQPEEPQDIMQFLDLLSMPLMVPTCTEPTLFPSFLTDNWIFGQELANADGSHWI